MWCYKFKKLPLKKYLKIIRLPESIDAYTGKSNAVVQRKMLKI